MRAGGGGGGSFPVPGGFGPYSQGPPSPAVGALHSSSGGSSPRGWQPLYNSNGGLKGAVLARRAARRAQTRPEGAPGGRLPPLPSSGGVRLAGPPLVCNTPGSSLEQVLPRHPRRRHGGPRRPPARQTPTSGPTNHTRAIGCPPGTLAASPSPPSWADPPTLPTRKPTLPTQAPRRPRPWASRGVRPGQGSPLAYPAQARSRVQRAVGASEAPLGAPGGPAG